MNLLKYVYNIRSIAYRKNEDGEKIITMQQRSTVDSRCRVTNYKLLVSQSMSAVLRQDSLSDYC